jgi:DNA-binding IclR family transcriptional regulator
VSERHHLPDDSRRLPAPAVAAAVRILDFLAKGTPRAGVTEIARALGVNKSTCYNILLTLAHFGVVARIPGHAKYQLGPRLAELGRALRRQYGHRDVLRAQLEDLVASTGLACVIGQALGDETSFVIIDRIVPVGAASPGPAPHVGAVFPLTGPAMGRALLSCRDEDDAIGIVRAIVGDMGADARADWRRQLREIRRRGYAVSLEEYEHGVNAVASPIEGAGEAYLVVALIGRPSELDAGRIAELGPRLVRAARETADVLAIAGRDG